MNGPVHSAGERFSSRGRTFPDADRTEKPKPPLRFTTIPYQNPLPLGEPAVSLTEPAAVKRVRTPVLEIAYEERGRAAGPPVLLLHGFPDDVRCWDAVATALAEAGRRTFAPYLRGFGPTRFLSADTPRDGQFAALGRDAIDFAEALDLRNLTVVGHDWGTPAAEILAAFRPERVVRLVKLNHYGVYAMAEIAARFASGKPPSYEQLQVLWYVWLLNLELGKQILEHDRRNFCRALWESFAPAWDPRERAAAFERVAASFDNPDFAEVAVSAYRHGVTETKSRDPRYDDFANQLRDPPPVRAATVLLFGAGDGVGKTLLSPEGERKYFTGPYRHEELRGVGHWPQWERPAAVVQAILDRSESKGKDG
jgi:pimeloyl-ACP methyl ester carboxylesterase